MSHNQFEASQERERPELFTRNSGRVRSRLAALFALVCLAAPLWGADDMEPAALQLDRPYQLRIVLDVARHRLLTPVFKDQVKRELQDGLRTALGDLARVTIVTEDPRLDAIRRFGLKSATDKVLGLNESKLHFVLVDYADGQYEVQTRQYDGLTDLPSPVVRTQRTSDRQFVARLATFLVAQDFGLVGKVKPGADPKKVEVTFKGGPMGVPLERWVHKGDVLLVSSVVKGAPTARRATDTLLVVDEVGEKGACKARLFHRFSNPVARKDGDYRCLRIHTIKAPLRVEVVQSVADSNAPPERVGNLRVEVRRYGFEGEESTKMQLSTDNDGQFSTEKEKVLGEFDRVAFVTLLIDPKRALVPIALVDDQLLRVKIDSKNQLAKGLLAIKRGLWDDKAAETGQLLQELFKELNQIGAKGGQRDALLRKAKDGLSVSQEARKQLAGDRDDLLKEAQMSGGTVDTSVGDAWIKFIDGMIAQLDGYVKKQEEILKEENDPKKQEFRSLREQGRLEEERGEVAKALELYDRAINTRFDDGTVKKRRDALAARWEPKNEEHRTARLYLESAWASVDLVATPAAVGEARKAFEVYKKNNDVLGAKRFRQTLLAVLGRLKAQKDALAPDVNEEDKKTLERIADLFKELPMLGREVEAFIQQNSK